MSDNAAKRLGRTARELLRKTERAALATLAEGGGPYASLVLVADDVDASPILLISALAEHAKNLARDGRASLLIDGTAGLAEPLTGARVTLIGRLVKTDDPKHKARYIERHPGAARYASFTDFACWRMSVERAHLVEGFGRIAWIEGADFRDGA